MILSAESLILYLRQTIDHGIITDKHGTEYEYGTARNEIGDEDPQERFGISPLLSWSEP